MPEPSESDLLTFKYLDTDDLVLKNKEKRGINQEIIFIFRRTKWQNCKKIQ